MPYGFSVSATLHYNYFMLHTTPYQEKSEQAGVYLNLAPRSQ